jgi:methionine-rich copper-binding protein CopC
MMFRRLTAVFLLVGLALVSSVTPAFAHAELTGSNPAKGATLDVPPQRIQLTFNETVSPQSITVTGPGNTQWTVGEIKVEGPVVTAPVTGTGPAGQYTITYNVLSDDGDPVTGTVAFTVKAAVAGVVSSAPPSSTAAKPGSSDDSGGLPTWLWLLGIVVLLVAGAVIGRRFNRPPSSPTER